MNDSLEPYFSLYLQVVEKADAAFAQVSGQYPQLVMCKPGCTDCCSAVFEMQPIEAAYLSIKFHLLFSRKERREINKKAAKALARLANVESRMKSSGTPSELKAQLMALSHERVECPLLMQGRCLLYLHRPVTCRIYGIPTSIEGKGATCGRSGFVQGERYPTISMEIIDNRLYEISRALMADIAGLNLSHGELLFSVAAALSQLLDQEYFIKLKNPCS